MNKVSMLTNFTFMLPCVVTDLFLITNQTHYLCSLFCHKTLHVSGNSFAHHQESPAVHSALISFMQVMMTAAKQSQDRAPWSFILTLLGSGHHNLHETYQCRLHSRRLLMMGKEFARNM
jgi:hypothetical protein